MLRDGTRVGRRRGLELPAGGFIPGVKDLNLTGSERRKECFPIPHSSGLGKSERTRDIDLQDAILHDKRWTSGTSNYHNSKRSLTPPFLTSTSTCCPHHLDQPLASFPAAAPPVRDYPLPAGRPFQTFHCDPCDPKNERKKNNKAFTESDRPASAPPPRTAIPRAPTTTAHTDPTARANTNHRPPQPENTPLRHRFPSPASLPLYHKAPLGIFLLASS